MHDHPRPLNAHAATDAIPAEWASWDGIRKFEAANHDYLQGQIGNPEGADKPNKKFYDPRVWLRKSEEAAVERLGEAFADLKSVGSLS